MTTWQASPGPLGKTGVRRQSPRQPKESVSPKSPSDYRCGVCRQKAARNLQRPTRFTFDFRYMRPLVQAFSGENGHICARRPWSYKQKPARINSLGFFQQALITCIFPVKDVIGDWRVMTTRLGMSQGQTMDGMSKLYSNRDKFAADCALRLFHKHRIYLMIGEYCTKIRAKNEKKIQTGFGGCPKKKKKIEDKSAP